MYIYIYIYISIYIYIYTYEYIHICIHIQIYTPNHVSAKSPLISGIFPTVIVVRSLTLTYSYLCMHVDAPNESK